MTSPFDPIDPTTVSGEYLRQRTAVLLAAIDIAADLGLPQQAPPPEGWYRCFVCRREFQKQVPEAEAEAEYRRRFPGGPYEPFDPDSPFVLCDDCNRIVSEDQGVPL